MGAPKQKWIAEEEAALRAGVAKYGPGKWSTILKDLEFSSVLHSRSNVDLKDKWRNLNFMSNGCASRQRARPALLQNQPILKPDDNFTTPKEAAKFDVECDNPKPLAVSTGTLQKGTSKIPIPRLDNVILQSIANLKEPRGSSRAVIAAYIEEIHSAFPNLEQLLAAELKDLTNCGKLIKVKNRYRIGPSSSYLGSKKNLSPLLPDVKEDCSTKAEMNALKVLTKAEIDAELEKMRSMTPEEAAAAAVRAVAEAEAAIAEADKAAREAEAAEADAELAQVLLAAARANCTLHMTQLALRHGG